MPENKKYKLLFRDRIGIVFDITQLMLEHKLNIISMEVEQKDGFARISLEIEGGHSYEPSEILELFSSLPGIDSQCELKRLPQKKEKNGFVLCLTA